MTLRLSIKFRALFVTWATEAWAIHVPSLDPKAISITSFDNSKPYLTLKTLLNTRGIELSLVAQA